MEEGDPEEIAQKLFNQPPQRIGVNRLVFDNIELNILFEILITIFLEGIMILYKNLQGIKMSDLDISYINKLAPWFESIGFKLNIKSFNIALVYGMHDNEQINKYYNKIILRIDPTYTGYFDIKKIQKEYTFLYHPDYTRSYKMLNEIYAIIIKNNTVYKISFDMIIDNDTILVQN